MDCEEICKQFWKEGEKDVCDNCQPYMRALMVNVCKGVQVAPGTGEDIQAPAAPKANVQKLVSLDDDDSMIDKLEWNNIITAMEAVGKSGIPKEQAETIELIITEIKRRGTL